MQKLFVFTTFCLAVIAALPYELAQDEDGQEYYLVPLLRQRRATPPKGTAPKSTVKWDVRDPAIASVENRRILIENQNHKLQATAFAEKNFYTDANPVAGGKIEYDHLKSGSALEILGKHTKHGGNDLAVQGKWNIYKKKDAGLELTGAYNQHFGSPAQTGPIPTGYNAFLTGYINY